MPGRGLKAHPGGLSPIPLPGTPVKGGLEAQLCPQKEFLGGISHPDGLFPPHVADAQWAQREKAAFISPPPSSSIPCVYKGAFNTKLR